ncbi:hypothetical protein BROUX41_005306 [Berkeleyomyces rouxiae]|uniref:uncharacterized protein n=1 Tax=Berkeleyomyces rouxiae TaxID=2035830 RepID=UPI003B75FBFE
MSSPTSDPATDMAAVMGFASFGNAPRPAKRARNDFTVVDSAAFEHAQFLPSHGTNANAIELGPSSYASSRDAATDQEPAQQHALKPLPASLPARPPPTNDTESSQSMDQPRHRQQGRGREGGGKQYGHKGEGNSGQQRGRGERNALWYIDYYDPMSNENPWEDLEKKAGLEPLGTWLPRGHARQQQRASEGEHKVERSVQGQKQHPSGEDGQQQKTDQVQEEEPSLA